MLGAFPSVADLSMLASFHMSENLAAIVSGGRLPDQVFELIGWAEAQGRLEDLVAAAQRAVPGNAKLTAVAEDFARWKSVPASVNPSAPGPAVPDINLTKLRTAMTGAFSTDDLHTLCADVEQELNSRGISLPVSLEAVGGDRKDVQVLKLIQYLQHRGHLAVLVQVARAARPGLI